MAAVKAALRDNREWRWIVVPRHLSAVPLILEAFGSMVVHLSEMQSETPFSVGVIERYGILEEMYSIADAAVVGGSFVTVGCHNVWEAAQYGIPVFFGPHYFSQQESCRRLLEAGVGFSVDDGEALYAALIRVLHTDARTYIASQTAFSQTISKSSNILEQIVL
jgi:3-deoxy-D-manno-octulosonic-acid transferase